MCLCDALLVFELDRGVVYLGCQFSLLTLLPPETNVLPLAPKILPTLIQILAVYQEDPDSLVDLALKLLKPVPFTQALTLASEDALVQALRSPSPSMNILAMAVLEKAANSPGDTALLSVRREVVQAFLGTWLGSPHVEVGERAAKALGDLLSMDCDHRSSADLDSRMHGLAISSETPPGGGLLWRRIFQDGEIYKSLFDLCSFKTLNKGESKLDERQKSLAQARLLRILPRLATLNFPAISKTDFPDVERNYGVQEGEQGILWFAATNMVNKEEDVLMHMMVIDFFPEFIKAISETKPTHSTYDYLFLLRWKVTSTDIILRQTLEDIERDPETSEQMRILLMALRTGERPS